MDDPLPQGGSESSAGASGLVECSVDTVRVDVGDAPYCIDAVEVVRSAYRQFLAATPAQPAVPGCWWNTSLVPNGWSSGDHGDGALPATGVDWCDAAAFCQWKGRSLCGATDDSQLPYGEYAGESDSWYLACTGGRDQAYPYGTHYDPNACNGALGAEPRAAKPGQCEGGLPTLLDLSGNVWEWEGVCDGTDGRYDKCRLRGGSFGSSSIQLACAYSAVAERDDIGSNIGFRCCSH
ncbi:MAG: SUMF1/EgtB/PvdO family nonheme iron enzyme [Myxococcales bacterium]|nr:SUMF1/EgtB/PvdO family nonheme iron enzyme [Myxococcales bacterium]